MAGRAKLGAPLGFAHYEVARRPDGAPWELGRGAMGVTYKAFDTRLKVDVALKVIMPERVDDPAAQNLFRREARAAAKVNHPNVAMVVFLNDEPGHFFYAMEFIAGTSLRDWAAENRPLALDLALAFGQQLAGGLESIHHEKIVHRDLKPANVMVVQLEKSNPRYRAWADTGGRLLKIIDFGLAKGIEGASFSSLVASQSAGFRGTALYASPEQCEEMPLDGRSDLYSLGCILWEMIIGAPPFGGKSYLEVLTKHVSHPVPSEPLARMPGPVAGLLRRLLAKTPDERFANAAELIDALAECRRGLAASGGGATTAVPSEMETAAVSSPRLLSTTMADRYRRGERVHAGFGGDLFRAADNLRGQVVALKVLAEDQLEQPGFAARVAAEIAKVHRRFSPHLLVHEEAVLRFEEDGRMRSSYVREWAEGFTLRDLLAARHLLRAAEARMLLADLPTTLDFAQSAGLGMVSVELGKLFVTPVVPGAEGPARWLREPVEQWGAWVFKLNPLAFLPTGSGGAELTRLNSRRHLDPAVPGDAARALARLLRTLLGGDPAGTSPLTGLDERGNAVLRQGLSGGFGTAGALWETFGATLDPRASAGTTPVPAPLPPPAPVPPSVAPMPATSWPAAGGASVGGGLAPSGDTHAGFAPATVPRPRSMAALVAGTVALAAFGVGAWIYHNERRLGEERTERARARQEQTTSDPRRSKEVRRTEDERRDRGTAEDRARRTREEREERERDDDAQRSARSAAEEARRERERLEAETLAERARADQERRLREQAEARIREQAAERVRQEEAASAARRQVAAEGELASAREFAKQMLPHNWSNDANAWASDFADRVDYCYKRDGYASRAYIAADRAKLVSRWPERRYTEIQYDLVPRPAGGFTINFSYRYTYASYPKSATGFARVGADIVRNPSGRWEIVAFREVVTK